MQPVIELDNLEVRFGERPILKKLNRSLTGRAIGLLGPNGAGKSTLINTLLGFHQPFSGTARIFGRPVRIGRPLGIAGLPDAAKGSAFAAAAGLLAYPQLAHLEHFEPRHARHFKAGTGGYIARVGRWLRESF